jgi:hypothetical protein
MEGSRPRRYHDNHPERSIHRHPFRLTLFDLNLPTTDNGDKRWSTVGLADGLGSFGFTMLFHI